MRADMRRLICPHSSSITGKAAGSYSWASAIKEVL
jgi:hypothetical protein